jgi:hypothetical protein
MTDKFLKLLVLIQLKNNQYIMKLIYINVWKLNLFNKSTDKKDDILLKLLIQIVIEMILFALKVETKTQL